MGTLREEGRRGGGMPFCSGINCRDEERCMQNRIQWTKNMRMNPGVPHPNSI